MERSWGAVVSKNMIKRIVLTVSFFTGIIGGFGFFGKAVDKDYKITNVKIYKDTPVWKLALAVNDEETENIKEILEEDKTLINYQEPKYGSTLLLWAVGMEKYKAVEMLLKCGADPDIATTNYGETPLFIASGYSWIDNDAKKDPKYVEILLKYGANPNINYIGSNIQGKKSVIEPGTSPLMNSIGSGIEKTKALVEAGADINYKTDRGKTAAIEALLAGGPNASSEAIEYAHYLIVEKKAKVSEPYYRRQSYGNEDPDEKLFAVNLLRRWVFKLDSKEHKMKMEIVEEFAKQGVNYWDTNIYDDTLSQIKKLFPDTWEEYIKKY